MDKKDLTPREINCIFLLKRTIKFIERNGLGHESEIMFTATNSAPVSIEITKQKKFKAQAATGFELKITAFKRKG